MKKIFILLLMGWGLVSSQVKEANQIENLLQRQLEAYLSQVLPPNSFLITTSAQVKINQISQDDEVTVNTSLDESTPVLENKRSVPNTALRWSSQDPLAEEPVFEDTLPGFEAIDGDTALPTIKDEGNLPQIIGGPTVPIASKKENTTTTTKKIYRDELEIVLVAVQVVLDETLDQTLVATVKQVVSDKIAASYEGRGTVRYSTGRLINTNFRTPPEDEKDVDYYLDKYAFLIYMFFAVFIFFVMLVIFFFFIWLFIRMLTKKQEEEQRRFQNRLMRNVTPMPRNQPPQMFPPYPPGPPYPYGGGQYQSPQVPPPYPSNVIQEKKTPSSSPRVIPASDDEEVSHAKKEVKEQLFLEKFMNDPLIGRNFFLNLESSEQDELVGAFPKYNTRKIFNRLNKTEEQNKPNQLDQIRDTRERERRRDSIFTKYIEALDQHQKLFSSQLQDVFGQISFLTGEELDILFSSLDVEAVVNSYQVIDSRKIMRYLERLPDERKNEFVKAMAKDKKMSESELTELKQLYRSRIKQITRNIFIDKPDKKEVQEKIFQTVKNKKAFLQKIETTDPDFYESHKKYVMDFDDMVEMLNSEDPNDRRVVYRAVDDSDNNVLSNALANLPVEQREAFIFDLPEGRKDFINDTMLPKIGQIGKDEEEEAREILLNQFRDGMFR